MQLATLLEDPEGATVLRLAREAHAALRDHNSGGGHAGGSGAGAGRQAARSAWIAPAPALVRMRLFCLPYAGGVSENIFARRARLGYCLFAVAPFAVGGRAPIVGTFLASNELTPPCTGRAVTLARFQSRTHTPDGCAGETYVGNAHRWAALVPACIQVCPVEILGRGRREGEPALTDAAELARVLAHALPLQASYKTAL